MERDFGDGGGKGGEGGWERWEWRREKWERGMGFISFKLG